MSDHVPEPLAVVVIAGQPSAGPQTKATRTSFVLSTLFGALSAYEDLLCRAALLWWESHMQECKTTRWSLTGTLNTVGSVVTNPTCHPYFLEPPTPAPKLTRNLKHDVLNRTLLLHNDWPHFRFLHVGATSQCEPYQPKS